MKRMQAWQIALVVISFVAFCVQYESATAGRKQAQAQAQEQPRQSTSAPTYPPVTLSILAPQELDKRKIEMLGGIPQFQVELHNVSDAPQRAPSDHAFGNNATIKLEILAIDGKTLREPVVVERRPEPPMVYSGGVMTFQPGETRLHDIRLYRYAPGERGQFGASYRYPDEYLNFPPLSVGEHTLSIRVVYESKPNNPSVPDAFWTGRVVSPTQDCVVSGPFL